MPECEECGEDAVLFTSETPLGTFRLCVECTHSVCRLCGKADTELEYHHVSYLFDTGLSLCEDCHYAVHHGDEHDELKPTVTRSHAKDIGVDGTLLD